jgi:hypothetical protein
MLSPDETGAPARPVLQTHPKVSIMHKRGGIREKVVQPGYALLVAALLFVIGPLLPTTGLGVRIVHVVLLVLAILLAIIAVGWLLVPWGLPEEQKEQSDSRVTLDPRTGTTTVYGGRTSASVFPILGGGWAIHTEDHSQPSPLLRRFFLREPTHFHFPPEQKGSYAKPESSPSDTATRDHLAVDNLPGAEFDSEGSRYHKEVRNQGTFKSKGDDFGS